MGQDTRDSAKRPPEYGGSCLLLQTLVFCRNAYTANMTNQMPHHDPDTIDLDSWLDATDALAPGNRNARTFPQDTSVVHMTGPSGDIVLRQWPTGTSDKRIGFLANVLEAAREAAGDVIPTIDPVPGNPEDRAVLVRGHYFTRSPYLEGRPLGRYGGYTTSTGRTINVPLHESARAHALVEDVARIMARVHQATQDVAARADAPVITLASVLTSAREIWFEQRRILGDRAAGHKEIRRWLRCGNRIIPTASDLLRNEEALMFERSVVVHGDLWPVNVLVQGREDQRQVTGLLGWSTAAAGSPVLDIAALSVHMQGWSAALTEAIVESYSQVTPLRPEQRRLVPAVASLDLVARVAELLNLAYVDDRMIGHPDIPVLRSGMKTLLNSLETLTSILAPDTNQSRRHQRDLRAQFERRGRPERPANRPGVLKKAGKYQRNDRKDQK